MSKLQDKSSIQGESATYMNRTMPSVVLWERCLVHLVGPYTPLLVSSTKPNATRTQKKRSENSSISLVQATFFFSFS